MSEQAGLTACFPGYKIQDMTHLQNVHGTITQPKMGKEKKRKKRILSGLSVIMRLVPENSTQKNKTSGNNDLYGPIVDNYQRYSSV